VRDEGPAGLDPLVRRARSRCVRLAGETGDRPHHLAREGDGGGDVVELEAQPPYAQIDAPSPAAPAPARFRSRSGYRLERASSDCTPRHPLPGGHGDDLGDEFLEGTAARA
jgi:hypothetical protein